MMYKLCVLKTEYCKGFRWILKARCGYKIDARVTKAAKMINNSCPNMEDNIYCSINLKQTSPRNVNADNIVGQPSRANANPISDPKWNRIDQFYFNSIFRIKGFKRAFKLGQHIQLYIDLSFLFDIAHYISFKVLSLFAVIYGLTQYDEVKYFVAIILGFYVLCISYSIFEILKNDKIIADNYYCTKKVFIIILISVTILLIGICIICVDITSDKTKVIPIIIMYFILIFLLMLRKITFNEYVKENRDIRNNSQCNRQLEQGN
ncbi:hypothetical protein BCR32DRAFT_280939 [Anaeromyces robustus]|uniref:Uncharacterized protein n=1 Tax=Anaeromyces robustus TaxID=1754192 RepID=A0A1Y1X2D4_9FUNG|nr:hypothetical protein BCR32DRAFT_280939 [Anaeromyces robustus]|eukprot:ORX79961.1 hypothetical protein BCR32DRAFT_280939 [Anaeromyces robustus]